MKKNFCFFIIKKNRFFIFCFFIIKKFFFEKTENVKGK